MAARFASQEGHRPCWRHENVSSRSETLQVYFLYHRELLGELSRAAYETLRELMVTATFEDDAFRPGMVSVVQTFGEAA